MASKFRITKAEKRRRMTSVEESLAAGYRHSSIVAAFCQQYGVHPKTAEKYITDVYRNWRKQGRKTKRYTREAQLRRLYKVLEDAKLSNLERIRTETLIAKIEGNEAPIKLAGAADAEPIRVEVLDYRGMQGAP